MHDYLEKRSLSDQVPRALWEQWELQDSFMTYKPLEAALKVTAEHNNIVSHWETIGFSVSIQREIHASHLAETVPNLVFSFTHACNNDLTQEIQGLIVFKPKDW